MKMLTILAIAACLTIVVVVLQIKDFPEFKKAPDAAHYITMAEGHSEKVILPYASRIFYPWVVGKLGCLLGTDASFLIVGTLSLFIFLAVVLWVLCYEVSLSFFMSTALIFIPGIFLLFYNLYRPNLFFCALSSIYFVLLIRKKYLISLFILFFLFLTREETVIIASVFILAMLINVLSKRDKKMAHWFYIFSAFIVGCLGYAITAYASRNNANIHHLPALFYLFFKFACFTMRSLTGFSQWVDTYRVIPIYTHPPLLVFDSPEWLRRISNIKEFGIYEWNVMEILNQLLPALAIFGTGPAILLYFIKKRGLKAIIKSSSVAFNAILLYGITMFILAPFTGNDLFRFYFNAWPVFFLIVPFFLIQINRYDKKIFIRVMSCYVLSAWILAISFYAKGLLYSSVLIVIEIALYRYTWRTLSLFPEKFYPNLFTDMLYR